MARLLILTVIACGQPPAPVGNRAVVATGACPTASQVVGPVQARDAEQWELILGTGTQKLAGMNELGVTRFQPGLTWLLPEAGRPCSLRTRVLDRQGCDGQACEHTAVLAFSCDPVDTLREKRVVDSGHAIVVDGSEPTLCRLSRLVAVDNGQLDRIGLPPPVRRALEAAEVQVGRAVSVRVGHAGMLPSIWEIDSGSTGQPVTFETCRRPIWVFVRTPSGVVQLDVDHQIDGLLSESDTPKVVLSGPFSRSPSRAFDVTRLPTHVPGTTSLSSEGCMH